MGRRAEGFGIRWKRGWAYVRFTHEKAEHCIALGTRDAGEAPALAAREYAAVVSGRRRPVAPSGTLLALDELLAEWIEAHRGSLDDTTLKTFVIYARKFVAFFGTLDRITEGSIGDFSRARLRQVLRKTVAKERSALLSFLEWCREQGAIPEVPTFPQLPRKATGTRAGGQRATSVDVTPEEAHAIIEKLPARSKMIAGRRWPVRGRFLVAFETGLRPATLSQLSVPEHYTRGAATLRIAACDDKARYAREVPLSDMARAALDAALPDAGLIFGGHCFDKALKASARAVLGEERGKRFAAYDFRHGRATQLVAASGDLVGAGFLLGHKHATTTNRYVHGSRRAAERALAAVSGPFPAQAGMGVPVGVLFSRGDRRVSNPRQLDPQSSALPAELRPPKATSR